MTDPVQFNNAVEEVNEGTVQEVHAIADMDTATDFELKHTPNIEVQAGANSRTLKVTIGLKGISHPQTEEHFIEWVRFFVGEDIVGETTFGPNSVVEAFCEVPLSGPAVVVQSSCNLHGVWEARI
ncbi:MAG: hypothetical protein FWC59_00925 [Actinomycetia bacterium]|nr:hypothetical protein [Actinomycetes bacterium]